MKSKRNSPPSDPWRLYFIECRGGGLYVGIAKDVDARYRRHVAGAGARYTRLHPPLRLLGSLPFPDRRTAARAERAVKALPVHEKRRWALASGGENAVHLLGGAGAGDIDDMGRRR